MAIKKSELYASLWKSCDELRGGMDASQYKDYVLVLLFMKYVSDKAASQRDYPLDVPPGGSFADMVALKGDKDIGNKINKIIAKLADANENLKGAIDVADFNDPDKLGKGKEMVDRLSNLVSIFDTPALDFRGNRTEGDDLLGDAYEYLMRHFATESGKSKGQFYTPAEVSRIMAQVIGLGGAKSANQSIYDPTCGSGSLLLKAHDEAKSRAGLDLAIYGQEMDNATSALARMNMVLHDAPTAEIWQDNTLSNPHFRDARSGGLKRFDFVVANPPFSTKSWTNGFNPPEDEFRRFPYGLPPNKNGDYAFLLHILASLKSTGKGAVILPHGVLFRGNAESTIRREIVRRGYIKGIIGLPANLFYGTGIPACVLVVDKEGAADRAGIFMVDAGRGFMKDGNKNRLRAQDIHRIVDTFTRQVDTPGYARLVPLAEIEANDFNLNLPRYIDGSEREDLQDIDGHLRGGIPSSDLDALGRYWEVFPGVRRALFESAGRIGYSHLRVAASEINATIFGHPEFVTFNTTVTAIFDAWRAANEPCLKSIAVADKPKDLIGTLSESLLTAFRQASLIDPYDVYQRLMDYWTEVLQDDTYLIVGAGWAESAKPRLIVDADGQRSKEAPDFLVGKQRFKSDLIPASLLISRYLSVEQAAIGALEAEDAAIGQRLAELAQDHGGEGGLLEDVVDESGKITKKALTARLREIANDDEAVDEREQLKECASVLDDQANLKGRLKAARGALEAKVAARYGQLTNDEVKALVVDDKWLARLGEDVHGEVSRVSQALRARIRQLAVRYADPLPLLVERIEVLALRVDEHLRDMGVTCR
jgi:type I restriction enzyme M protein